MFDRRPVNLVQSRSSQAPCLAWATCAIDNRDPAILASERHDDRNASRSAAYDADVLIFKHSQLLMEPTACIERAALEVRDFASLDAGVRKSRYIQMLPSAMLLR